MGLQGDTSFRQSGHHLDDEGMFAIILDYTAPIDQIDNLLDEHVAWLDTHYRDGVFLASGRREPRTGGVILATDMPIERAQALADSDPFARHGVAIHTLVRFHPSKLTPALTDVADLLA